MIAVFKWHDGEVCVRTADIASIKFTDEGVSFALKYEVRLGDDLVKQFSPLSVTIVSPEISRTRDCRVEYDESARSEIAALVLQ